MAVRRMRRMFVKSARFSASCRHAPVRGALGQPQPLRRRLVLAAGAEGAGGELLVRLGRDPPDLRTRAVEPARREDDVPPGARVGAALEAQAGGVGGGVGGSRNGFSRSIGAGKTIFVDADGPSSSSVCR